MHFSTALALTSAASFTAAHPFRFSRREVASFPAGSSWDILLAKGDINLKNLTGTASESISAIDIDLFDNDADTISQLKSQNKQVICYFSAGSREDWRSDSSSFQSSDYGQALEGWEGENWLNVKSDNVKNIMKQRIQQAAQKGCSAIDPDNVDGFQDNQDGYGYQPSDYANYVKFLAQEAAANNMAIGLKNAIDLIPDVIDSIQFAVNEQCHEYGECGSYKPFTDANKAVFNIEYGGDKCDQPDGVKLSILIKPKDQALNSLGGACASSGQTDATTTTKQPASSATATSSVKATPTSSAVATGTAASSDNEEDNDDQEQDGEEDDE